MSVLRKCTCCGWIGHESQIKGKDFYMDYGDVYLRYCPRCGMPDECYDLFEKVESGKSNTKKKLDS